MLIPPRQRGGLLGSIVRAIINTSNAALVAADMVKHRFDDMRLDTDIGHAGSNRAPNVVNDPVAYARAFVEKVLLVRPGRKLEYCVTHCAVTS